MTGYHRTRWWIFGMLGCPICFGLIAFVWGFVLWQDFAARARFWYGFIPWLEAEWHPGLNWEVTHEIVPLGVVALSVVTAMIMFVFWLGIRSVVRQAEAPHRCQTCGYIIHFPGQQCPECGTPYPDPIVLKRKSHLGPIHRLLLAGIVFLSTIPGLLLWLMLIVRLRSATTVKCFGSASPYVDEMRAIPIAVLVMLISVLTGCACLHRYNRTAGSEKSSSATNPSQYRP